MRGQGGGVGKGSVRGAEWPGSKVRFPAGAGGGSKGGVCFFEQRPLGFFEQH